MKYQRPTVGIDEKRDLVRDEFWPAVALMFAVYAYNQYDRDQAVKACQSKGGLAEVTSKWLGMSWEVKCYQKK